MAKITLSFHTQDLGEKASDLFRKFLKEADKTQAKVEVRLKTREYELRGKVHYLFNKGWLK